MFIENGAVLPVLKIPCTVHLVKHIATTKKNTKKDKTQKKTQKKHSGTAPPASLLPSQTPQMIVITFEGAVTDRTTRIYKVRY